MRTIIKIAAYLMLFFLIVLAIAVPVLCEMLHLIPGTSSSDWLGFWAQYAGTWIALIGSSSFAMLIAVHEIKANRVTELRMYKIQERVKYLFEIVDIVSELEYQTEYPIFQLTKVNQIKMNQWKIHYEQVTDFIDFLGDSGINLSHYRFKLPQSFINTWWELLEQNSDLDKRGTEVKQLHKQIKNDMARYNKEQDKNKKDKIEQKIRENIVKINSEINGMRDDYGHFCERTLIYIDKLETK